MLARKTPNTSSKRRPAGNLGQEQQATEPPMPNEGWSDGSPEKRSRSSLEQEDREPTGRPKDEVLFCSLTQEKEAPSCTQGDEIPATATPAPVQPGSFHCLDGSLFEDHQTARERALVMALFDLGAKEEEWIRTLNKMIDKDQRILTRQSELLGVLASLERAKVEDSLRMRRHEEKLTMLRLKREALHRELKEARKERFHQQDVKTSELQVEVDQLRDRNLNLEAAVEAEKEKQMCQICLVNVRDALVMPCMHLLYCSKCIFNQQQSNKNCPACRGPISAWMHCKLNLDE